ncbi:response regulator transcription factor [Verrucomicrobiaceae bacterium 227]
MPGTSSDPNDTRLLLIDDDVEFCELLGEYLVSLGYKVERVHRGAQGVTLATSESWQAIILDVMMPGMDGFEVLKEIRKSSAVPVLMLTGRGDEMDVVVGLELGADDYVPKTSSMRQLVARLRAVTRRSQRVLDSDQDAMEPDIQVGAIWLSPSRRKATLGEVILDLTPVEFDLLAALMSSRGRVRSREALLHATRNRDYEIFDRSIDMHISAIRRKLGDNARSPKFIRTYRNVGYKFLDPEVPSGS